MQAYLAGAMQAAPDRGATWRELVTPSLEAMGIQVFNPCLSTDTLIHQKYGFTGTYPLDTMQKLYDMMREIVDADLQAVEQSQILLVYFDEYVKGGAGTYGEITCARWLQSTQKEPRYIYLVRAHNIKPQDIPSWVYGCVDYVFDNFNECFQHIRKEHVNARREGY